MSDWPLHVTLADVFAMDRIDIDLEDRIVKLLTNTSVVEAFAKEDSVLGETPVVILEKSKELLRLHYELINILTDCGAVFNNPEFTKDGFIPHCTIQNAKKINIGDQLLLSTISLIDMFPNNDWSKRKVLRMFTIN